MVHAVTWEISQPCEHSAAYQGEISANLDESVGEHSITVFDLLEIDYVGSSSGVNSLMGTPTGMEALEVLSDTEMRSYGWCYQVNGFEPAALAGEYYFSSQNDHLTWMYGFAHYKDGEWLSYCEPAYRSESCEEYK